MKTPQKKDTYVKVGKRNAMTDILTDAGRRAKNRAAEKEAEERLRNALQNPTDSKGKPVAAHELTRMAAERVTTSGSDSRGKFGFASRIFLSHLKYQWGSAPSVSELWKLFLSLARKVDSESASDFAKNYEFAFRWCLAGHLNRIESEYLQRPEAIVMVEIYEDKAGVFSVARLQDGSRRVMLKDAPPEQPMIAFAGSRIHSFLAPRDLKKLRQLGAKAALAALESGRFKFSERPLEILDEDMVLNVARPTPDSLAKIQRDFCFLTFLRNQKT